MNQQWIWRVTGLSLLLLVESMASAQTVRTITRVGAGTGGTGGTGGTANAASTSSTAGAGQIAGNERFLRQNRQPGQLVGGTADAVGVIPGSGTTTGTTGQFGGGMNQFGGGMNQFGGGFGMNPMNQMMAAGMMNSLSRQKRQLRMPMLLGSELTSNPAMETVTPVKMAEKAQVRFSRIPQIRDNTSVKVEMVGQVAWLRGEVKSQHDRDLIGRMILLEPGIADVRNELVVKSKPTSSTSP